MWCYIYGHDTHDARDCPRLKYLKHSGTKHIYIPRNLIFIVGVDGDNNLDINMVKVQK